MIIQAIAKSSPSRSWIPLYFRGSRILYVDRKSDSAPPSGTMYSRNPRRPNLGRDVYFRKNHSEKRKVQTNSTSDLQFLHMTFSVLMLTILLQSVSCSCYHQKGLIDRLWYQQCWDLDKNLGCDGVQIHSRHFLLSCPVQLSRNSRKWRSGRERRGYVKRTSRYHSRSYSQRALWSKEKSYIAKKRVASCCGKLHRPLQYVKIFLSLRL